MAEEALNKNILLICGVIATVMGFLTELVFRPLILNYEINDFGINGFAPNFFTAVGLSLFVAITTKKKPIISMAFGTLGILAYETEQIWTDMTFDYADIIATLVGYGLSVLIVNITSNKSNVQVLIHKG